MNSYTTPVSTNYISYIHRSFSLRNPDAKQKKTANLSNDVKNHEFQLILEKLEDFSGNRKDVAQALGISERTLRYKLAKMREQGIEL